METNYKITLFLSSKVTSRRYKQIVLTEWAARPRSRMPCLPSIVLLYLLVTAEIGEFSTLFQPRIVYVDQMEIVQH